MLSARNQDTPMRARPSFEELYDVACAHLPERLRLLKVPPEDVGDVVHEVVLIAHRRIDDYRPPERKPGDALAPRHALEAWLSGIAWRYVARQHDRAYRRLELPAGDGAALHAPELFDAPSSEQLAADAERRELLRRVLDALRPERAMVLVMHAIFQMPVPDIAGELGVNENTVRSRLGRARRDAQAAIRRLSPEERSALRGFPLFLPLAVEIAAPESPRSPPPWHADTAAAVLGCTFLLGLAAGVQVGRHRGHGVAAAEVVTVADVPPAAATGRPDVAPAVLVRAPAPPPPQRDVPATEAAPAGSVADGQDDLLDRARAMLLDHKPTEALQILAGVTAPRLRADRDRLQRRALAAQRATPARATEAPAPTVAGDSP